METMVQDWDGVLGIKLPERIINDFALRNGSIVSVRCEGSEIAVKPAWKASLSEMLEQMNEPRRKQRGIVRSPVELHSGFNTF